MKHLIIYNNGLIQIKQIKDPAFGSPMEGLAADFMVSPCWGGKSRINRQREVQALLRAPSEPTYHFFIW